MVNRNLKELESKYHELLTNLSEEDLKQYIKTLTNNYYSSFLSNDKELYESTFKQLEDVNSIYKVKYANFNSYINFCLLDAVHKILNERLSSGITLELIGAEEDFLAKNPFKSLSDAIEESRKLYSNDAELKNKIEELEKKLAEYEGVKSNGR